MSLHLDELDAIYGTVSHEEAIAIANLGAQCYVAAKEQLFSTWEAARDDTEREELWRKEGRMAMLESLKGRLAAGDAAQARVVELQSSIDAEVARRVDESIVLRMREVELSAQERILETQRELTELKCELKIANQAAIHNELLTFKVDALTTELQKYKESDVKSSHMIGKIGEATVLEMLESHISPRLLDCDVFNMTAVKHAGDFHVRHMARHGKYVTLMIDVKKYVANVSTIEVEKMFSDLDAGARLDGGILLSLDSRICKKQQFEISFTATKKPCLFISLENIDTETQKELIYWGINVLTGVVAHTMEADKDAMVSRINDFLCGLSEQVTALSGLSKTARQLAEGLHVIHNNILSALTQFKEECGIVDTVALPETAVIVSKEAGRCQAIRANGEQCKLKRKDGEFCKYHTSKDVISLVGESTDE